MPPDARGGAHAGGAECPLSLAKAIFWNYFRRNGGAWALAGAEKKKGEGGFFVKNEKKQGKNALPVPKNTEKSCISRKKYSDHEKNPVGAPQKYKTAAALRRAVDKYFRSISATVEVASLTGEPVLNEDGKPVKKTEYIVPPTEPGLCLFLGITTRTWRNYANPKLHPEFEAVTDEVKTRFEAYLVEQSLTREKGVQGVIFNLTNNYGYKQKTEIELGEDTRKAVASEPISLREKLLAIQAAKEALGEVPEEMEDEE